MKSVYYATAAALALAACSGNTSNENAAVSTTNAENAMPETENANAILPEAAPPVANETTAPPSADMRAQPKAETPPARRRPAPPRPKQEPVGHDMGNMANMSH